MTKYEKEVLNELSKEQLVYLIVKLLHSQFLISSACVRESKKEIDSDKAVDRIREYIYDMPSLYDSEELKNYIDMKMGEISSEEFRIKLLRIDEDNS